MTAKSSPVGQSSCRTHRLTGTSALRRLAAAYPDATELTDCPHRTHEDRPIHVLRIGTAGASDVDGVLLLGG
jgi:hypothetical protein